jgi:outer membrane protein assembly factor BamB
MNNRQSVRLAGLILAAAAVCMIAPARGQDSRPVARAAWPADKPVSPSALPGNGLAQHDFFYAGEAKTQDMYIVRGGRVVWEYHDHATKGEISDAVLLSNGNVLFAHQYGVTLISPDKKVLWRYDAPPNTEVHTAQAIGKERVLFVQNGDPAKVVVVNIRNGQTEREFTIPVKNPKSTHGHFRHARLTEAGTLLVAHMDLGKAVEYDAAGKELWSHTTGIATWSAVRLKNGNTLISGSKAVREVNPQGGVVWEFTPADVPDYKFDSMQIATRLANGNTLINNWVNQWSGSVDARTAPVQALEVTPDKTVVWALRAWGTPVDLGPSTTIQLLDSPSVPEAAHFGDLK